MLVCERFSARACSRCCCLRVWGAAAGATAWVVDGDGGAGVDFCEIQAAAGVDRVHSICASICAGLYACSKRDSNAMQKD
jgi:hypothetical protein